MPAGSLSSRGPDIPKEDLLRAVTLAISLNQPSRTLCSLKTRIRYLSHTKIIIRYNHNGQDLKSELKFEKNQGRNRWTPYAACARWHSSADKLQLIIPIAAGSCSLRPSIGSIWPMAYFLRDQSNAKRGASPSIEYSERKAAAASRLGARLIC